MSEERPPSADEVARALDTFVAAVRSRYGDRLRSIHLFGSRARGDASSYSDADVAVVIRDGDWSFWSEKVVLAGIAYDPLVDFGLHIQPWPISETEWQQPERHRNPRFVQNVHRDARTIETFG